MILDSYKCKCGKTKEFFRNEDPICDCGLKMERQSTFTNTFILKGEGWANQGYETPNKDMLKKCGDGEKFTPNNEPFEKSMF